MGDRAQSAGGRCHDWLPKPAPTTRLGLMRPGSFGLLDPERHHVEVIRSVADFVRRLLLGLAPGGTGGCVRDWLAEKTDAFRHRFEILIIDPSAP